MWTTDDLIEQVRRTGFLPASTAQGFSDADIIAHADEVMRSELVALVLSVRNEWYAKEIEIPLVSGQEDYRLPNRNMGGRISAAFIKVGGSQYELAQYSPRTALRYTTPVTSGQPSGYVFNDNAIRLVPKPSAGNGSLVVRYFFRLNTLRLLAPANTAVQISTITPDAPIAGQTTIALTGHAFTAGNLLDIIRNNPNFETAAFNVPVISATAAVDVVVDSSLLPRDFATSYDPYIGSWVTPQYQSVVLQAPTELHGWWAEMTAAKLLESHGDMSKSEMARKRADKYKASALQVLTPRSEGEPKKVTNGVMQTMYGGGRGW